MLADDGIGGGEPLEWLGVGIVRVEAVADGLVEFDDGAEDAALGASFGQCGKQALDGIDP